MSDDQPMTRLTLPSIPEFTLWMTTDGEEAPLYGIEQKGAKTICYAESKTGQPFAIHFSDIRESRDYGLMVELHMHGQWQRARVVEFKGPHEFVLSARRDGPASERPFIFDDIKTTADDKLACTDKGVRKSLGNIGLVINRWCYRDMVQTPVVARDRMYSTISDPVIHEDSKKANVSHAISYVFRHLSSTKPTRWLICTLSSFGEARPAAPTSTKSYYYDYHYVDQSGSPFYEFEFRCRSRQILDNQDLLPPPIYEETKEAASSTFEESIIIEDQRNSESSYSPSPEPRDYAESTLDSTLQTTFIPSDSEENEEAVSDDEVAMYQEQLANAQEKLAKLELQGQMADIKRRIASAKRVKREKVRGKVEESGVKKEVKVEREESASGSNGAKKGKGKEIEVLVIH